MKLTLNIDYKELGHTLKHTRTVTFNGDHFVMGDTVYYLSLEQREALLNHLAGTFTEKDKFSYDDMGKY